MPSPQAVHFKKIVKNLIWGFHLGWFDGLPFKKDSVCFTQYMYKFMLIFILHDSNLQNAKKLVFKILKMFNVL